MNKIFRSVFEDKVLSFLTVAGGWDREQSQKTKCLELSSYEFVELMKGAWTEPGLSLACVNTNDKLIVKLKIIKTMFPS